MADSKHDDTEGLTDEEIAALEEEDTPAATEGDDKGGDDKDDTPADDKGEKDKPDPDDKDEDPEKDADDTAEADAAAKAAADAKAKEEADAKAKQEADEKAAEQEVEEPAALIPPTFAKVEVPDVSDYASEREVLLDARKALRAQHRNGEVDSDEYDEKLDELNDKLSALDRRKQEADQAERINAANAQAQWQWTIAAVKAEVKRVDGVDYDANPALLAMWDSRIKALAADKANADKDGAWFLREAHKQVRTEAEKLAAALGFSKSGQPTEKGKPDAGKVKDAVDKRKPQDTKVKGVATVPPADNTDTGGDEFTDLDGLSGLELERALAKMPQDQADKYLRG